jgi:predicted DCC family thiol-disulfide oxidoreductase YuxK
MAPVILFDGECNLCHASVNWVIAHDPQAIFRFASLQSYAAGGLPNSVVLIDEEGVHTHSTAALRIARRLGFPYSLLAVFTPVPKFLRDAVYNFVAAHRYRWFGRRESCLLPTPELAARFLDRVEF